MKIATKAVGVTFEGRQEILGNLAQVQPWRDITLKLTQYEGEDAIIVEDYETKLQLGWIAKDKVQQFKGVRRMAGRIVCSRNTYGLQLFPHQEPSQRQYWSVRKYCERRGLAMPPYTRAAYETLFAVMRTED